MVSGLLGQDIGMDEPLMEAGLDSIGAVELRNSVASQYGIDLPATVTFDQPTVRALADYLAAVLAPQRRTALATDVGSFELVQKLPVTLSELASCDVIRVWAIFWQQTMHVQTQALT